MKHVKATTRPAAAQLVIPGTDIDSVSDVYCKVIEHFGISDCLEKCN